MKNFMILSAIAIIAVFLSASIGVAAAYMTVKHGAAFGWLLLAFIVGGVLLIDWRGDRHGQH